jgi:SAM-dependent methyltransferase
MDHSEVLHRGITRCIIVANVRCSDWKNPPVKSDAEGFWTAHDIHQIRNLNVLWPHSIRNRVVADVGCAAGSFLDHISTLAKTCLAVEPCQEYHHSLRERGYKVYDSINHARQDYQDQVDFAFSLSTVEHVENPFEFFAEIRQLLRPEGLFLVSTPNRNDILMDLLGDEYKRFFYRTVHRWYFDMESLLNLAKRCRFEIVQERCLQRFGISNALGWLKERRPTGDQPLPHFDDPLLNEFWKNYLESKGIGDYLYLLVKRGDK